MHGLPELKKLKSAPGVRVRILMSPEEITKSGKNKTREYKFILIPAGMKRCPRCKEVKQLNYFSFSKTSQDQRMGNCRKCNTVRSMAWQEDHKEYRRQYLKEWNSKNSIYVSDCKKQWREENKEVLVQNSKEYREKNRDVLLIKKKEYRERNTELILQKAHDYYWSHRKLKGRLPVMSEPMRKIKRRMGKAIWEALRGRKDGIGWETWVGYTVKDLMEHLESLFTKGMTWENYGMKGWHVDHKVPVVAFDFANTDSDEFRLCWSLENLQPLWLKDNLEKNSKILHPELLVKLTGRTTSRPFMGRSFKNIEPLEP